MVLLLLKCRHAGCADRWPVPVDQLGQTVFSIKLHTMCKLVTILPSRYWLLIQLGMMQEPCFNQACLLVWLAVCPGDLTAHTHH